jgi:regulation of enolase protein 1 (concanavalin A-like superfamily)
MCRKLTYLTSFIFILALAGNVLAQEADAEIPPAGTPLPVIDGIKEDVWSASEEHGILNLDADSLPDSPADCSGSWWALWDSDYLYVFVDVNDEDLQNDSGESWQDDSVEIYIDAGNDKPNQYLSAGDEYQYRAAWNPEVPEFQEYHHGNRSVPGVEFIVTETDDGYVLEAKFPWEALYTEGKPTLGDLMGFEVMINDDDGGGNRKTQLSWFSTGNQAWNNPSVFGTVVFAAGLRASNPNPRYGAEGVLDGLLQWIGGKNAESYNVYFGTNPTPGDDEFIQNQTETEYRVADIEPVTTYYWRIDGVEADGTTIQTGDVWSFTSAPLTAHSPDPCDGARWIDLDADLAWRPGMYAQSHDVYLGTDKTAVENADNTSEEFKGNQPLTTYEPGTLQANTTYYWRIDEVEDDGVTRYKGEVWRFTALGAGAGIKGEYYDNSNLTGQPVFTRIDDIIDFDWGLESPDDRLEVDNFSIRWTADLEVPFTETYTFITSIFSSDGIRLWIDGRLLIDHWDGQEPWERKATIDLFAGPVSLLVEYFDAGHRATAHLSWESPSIPRQIIPIGIFSLPIRAAGANPANGVIGVKQTPTLRWTAADDAAQHDVYFGTDYDAVANAGTTTSDIYRGRQELENTKYIPTEAPLGWGQTYYWRIDEILADGVTINKGHIWSFTVADYVVVEDFEDYNDVNNRIYDTWVDYYANNTGMTVGHFDPPFAERIIVHNGSQSMYMRYDNDGTVNEGTDYEQSGTLFYSEVEREWADTQDWTRDGVNSLTLWFRGIPASVGSFTAGPLVYTMTAGGADIWDTSDQFHYAYKQLSGEGSITAKVVSVSNTDPWAKAGVMIRQTMETGSTHATMVVTPENGVSLQHRPLTNAGSEDTTVEGITAPQWVRISRSGNTFTGQYSANGSNWTTLDSVDLPMLADVYIGLCLTSHNVDKTCTAEFSNVTTDGTGEWQSQDIGIESNTAEHLYLVLEDSTGNSVTVKHPDPAATIIDTWTPWNIPFTDFANVNMQAIKTMAIGVGDRADTQPGGAGDLYIDDIGLHLPPPAE